MKQSLEKYFNKPNEENNWISNQFDKKFFQTAISLSIVEIKNSIELSCDTTLKSEFNLIIFGYE